MTHRHGLTEKELAVVRLVVEGLSNGEIAAQLSKGGQTVKSQLHDVFEKLGLGSRVELALWAVAHGIAEIPERLR